MRTCEVGRIRLISCIGDSLLLCLMSLIHLPQCQGLPSGLWLVQVQQVGLICWPASWVGGAKEEEKKHDIARTTRVKLPGSLLRRHHLPAQPKAWPLPRLMSACMWGHVNDCIYKSVSITWSVVHSQSHGPTWIIQKAKRLGRWYAQAFGEVWSSQKSISLGLGMATHIFLSWPWSSGWWFSCLNIMPFERLQGIQAMHVKLSCLSPTADP